MTQRPRSTVADPDAAARVPNRPAPPNTQKAQQSSGEQDANHTPTRQPARTRQPWLDMPDAG